MKDEIRQAQVEVAEGIVVERLRAKGLYPPEPTPPALRLAQLERAVVEAAKGWRKFRNHRNSPERNIASDVLLSTLDELVEFESQVG